MSFGDTETSQHLAFGVEGVFPVSGVRFVAHPGKDSGSTARRRRLKARKSGGRRRGLDSAVPEDVVTISLQPPRKQEGRVEDYSSLKPRGGPAFTVTSSEPFANRTDDGEGPESSNR